ncbi:MAG TPA: AAA family ATPase [Saprospiraceae bacterium]|nr:AAA family ATPase [Saprospiraceae bacterium]HMP14431.1 AAA family ATPase [Saprospiraceae bacterium]
MDIKHELQQKVLEALKTMSQAELARKMKSQIGYGSDATVINLKQGNWELISEEAINKLRAFFKIDSWRLRSTHNFAVITKLCEDARDNRRFMAIAGYTGAGKTTALRYYTSQNADTYYVLATVLMTKRTFLEAVQRAMGINAGSSMADMMAGILNKLHSSSKPLLIIDDAGKLTHSCLRLLQVIYDQTEFSAGVVISGTEYLKTEIDRQARRDNMGFRELKRRIAYWQPLRRPTQSIISTICKDYNITDQNAISYIHEYAHDYGTIRNLVLNAHMIAVRDGVAISRDLLADLHVGDIAYETQKE